MYDKTYFCSPCKWSSGETKAFPSQPTVYFMVLRPSYMLIKSFLWNLGQRARIITWYTEFIKQAKTVELFGDLATKVCKIV